MDDNSLYKLEDKKYLANSKDRSKNTDQIVKKLDELKPTEKAKSSQQAMADFFSSMKGDEGEKGETGEQGLPGEKGEQGEQGLPGRDGMDGKDGLDGKDGADGIDGKDGADGINGKNGKDGSPDTAEQIVEKLSTIKKAWIELSQIKGLQQLLEDTGNNFLAQAKGFAPRALASLYDVDVRTITDQQTLVWDSVKKKFVPGTPATGGGTGFTKETPTGTVDGTNTVYTVTHTPNYVISDGITLFDGAGYALVGLTITLTVPPQEYIRSYY